MQRNLWAENQANTYLDAATRLRAAATQQQDETIVHHLEEIAERYEKLGKTIADLSLTSGNA
jgi:hypothetical protein